MPVSTAPADAPISRDERSDRTFQLFCSLAEGPSVERQAELRDEIVNVNLRVAKAVAARYRGRGVETDDLEQAAAHGLVKAVLRFDPARGKDFLSYAVPTIRGEVQRYFRDMSWTVRPPRHIQELQRRVSRSTNRLTGELGRDPQQSEIIDDLDITYGEYVEAVTAFGCFRPPSLDQTLGDSGTSPSSLHLGAHVASAATELEAVERHLVLRPMLDRLSSDDMRLIHLRFVEDRTQQQIGEEFGISQAQVSRWLQNVLARLRSEIGSTQDAVLAG